MFATIEQMEAAALTKKLNELITLNPDNLNDKELFTLVVQIEELTSAVHALTMPAQAAATRRKAHQARKYRSAATGIANETRLSPATCGRHLTQASLLIDQLPSIYNAYAAGVLNLNQVELICSYANKPKLLEFVIRDQNMFINWAHNPWPIYRTTLAAWAEFIDPIDPNNDNKDFENRRLITAQGVGKTMLIEWNIPNELWAEILSVVEPIYDMLYKEECNDARDDNGVIVFGDLARSDKQRMSDALVIAVRIGGRVTNKLIAHKAAQTNTDSDAPDSIELEDIDFGINDLDAGIDPEVIIIADQQTLEDEITRQNGQTPAARPIEDAETYRCETLNGLPVSPATALRYLSVGSFRKMIHKPGDLDFSISRRARLFKGPKRIGLIARSRHCQGPGCATKSHYCQGDHRIEYHKGGPTIPANAEMLCRPCHRHKTWMQAHGLWEQALQEQAEKMPQVA